MASAMIRLKPSQIDLSSRDLDETYKRLAQRRAARAAASNQPVLPLHNSWTPSAMMHGSLRSSWDVPGPINNYRGIGTNTDSHRRTRIGMPPTAVQHHDDSGMPAPTAVTGASGSTIRRRERSGVEIPIFVSRHQDMGLSVEDENLVNSILAYQERIHGPPILLSRNAFAARASRANPQDDSAASTSSNQANPQHDSAASTSSHQANPQHDFAASRDDDNQDSLSDQYFGPPLPSPGRAGGDLLDFERHFSTQMSLDDDDSEATTEHDSEPVRSPIHYYYPDIDQVLENVEEAISDGGHGESSHAALPPSGSSASYSATTGSHVKRNRDSNGDGLAALPLHHPKRLKEDVPSPQDEADVEAHHGSDTGHADSMDLSSSPPMLSHDLARTTTASSSAQYTTSQGRLSPTLFGAPTAETSMGAFDVAPSRSSTSASPELHSPVRQYRSRSPLPRAASASPPGPFEAEIEDSPGLSLATGTTPTRHHRRSMRVYNDQLPTSEQPRTPANRHPVTRFSSFTAPAGLRRVFGFGSGRRGFRTGSLGRAGEETTQENVDSSVEAERWQQRIRATLERRRRNAPGVEEGDSLDHTPERET